MLPLYLSASAALQQDVYCLRAEAIEIARHGVIQAPVGHGELESLLVRRKRQEPVDRPGGESIAVSQLVHDLLDAVVPADEEFASVVEAR
jgi:hypothetical protein